MDVIRFRIRHPDGRVDELLAESSRVLIGSGSHCEIRLPVDAAHAEHVLIERGPAGWRAIARSLNPAPKLDGIEFTEAPIRTDCEIVIGSIRIDVAPSAAEGSRGASPGPKGRAKPRIYLYLVLGVSCSIALYAMRVRPKVAALEPTDVPGLWAGAPEPKCPQTALESALSTANARLDMAITKQERSPFHPEDGVAAVPLYDGAAACFQVAGRQPEAEAAASDGDRLRSDMVDRFRIHRLRLQRALAVEEWNLAEREAGVLLAFLPPSSGEYVTWLSNLRRRLQLRYGAKSKKES